MIKIFNSDDIDFSTNGNVAIQPLSCIETKKKSLNGWYIQVEVPIKYKDYICQDKLCVVKTKSKLNPQAFSINDISYNQNKITFKAEHIAFRARDLFLLDCRPTSLNGSATLNYINQRTDNESPFLIVSDVEKISTAYFIRKNLLEAWETIEERWGGFFDFDNYTVYFKQKVGNDNGETIYYGKNMQKFQIYEDWSKVVTKLYPVGYDGLMLPEKYLESKVLYEKYYTKTVSFETDLNEDEITPEKLLVELREKGEQYLEKNQYPQVCYEVDSNIVQRIDIGDTIHVKHPLVELITEVQEYDYDTNIEKIIKLTFGNYNRDVKSRIDAIKENITNITNKVSKQEIDIHHQTDIINNLNKNGDVYIDDNEILILDKLPKEEAVHVLRLGLGGLGISENGIEGPFGTAITGEGINGDFITTGTVKTNRIEGYSQLITEVSNLGEVQAEQGSQIAQTIMDVNQIRNAFQITGGSNLIKDSQLLLKDEGMWIYGQQGNYSFFPSKNKYPSISKNPIEYYYREPNYIGGYDSTLIGKTVAIARIGISNGKMTTSETNITGLIIGSMYTLSYKISNDKNTHTKIKLIGNGNVIYEETFDKTAHMQELAYSFIAQTSKYKFEIQTTSTTDGYAYIYDLMLNKGDITPWEPAAGEIVSTTIKLSQLGVQVFSMSSEIATLMTSEGFGIRRYSNGTLYEIVTEFNKEGFKSKKGIVEQLEIDSYDFKTLTYQGYKTLVLYKKESDD